MRDIILHVFDGKSMASTAVVNTVSALPWTVKGYITIDDEVY